MKVLITGIKGQLGQALFKTSPKSINGSEVEIILCDRKMLDMRNLEKCRFLIEKYKPDWVINCGAYTNVDNSEVHKEIAFSVNFEAPKVVASSLKDYGGKMIQIRTD